MASFAPRLRTKTVAMFVDFQFEDAELLFPKMRLEEEGATVLIVGAHPQGTKYTGKYGYPVKSDLHVDQLRLETIDALVIPGGFAPDYMRRNKTMLNIISALMAEGRKPVAGICHAPWMFCSAKDASGKPVISGRQCTAFFAIKDDVVNAGATFVDAPVVIDGNLVTSRTPNDLVPFCHAIIDAILKTP